MDQLGLRGWRQTQDFQNQGRAGAQGPGQRRGHQIKDAEGHRRPERDWLGQPDSQRLGHQLAKHGVQEGDDGQADRGRHRVNGRGVPAPPPHEQGNQQLGHGGLTEPTQRQRRDGDAELAGRQVVVDPLAHTAEQARPASALVRQLLQAGGADLHHGEFGGHEETVRHYDQDGDDDRDGRTHGWVFTIFFIRNSSRTRG